MNVSGHFEYTTHEKTTTEDLSMSTWTQSLKRALLVWGIWRFALSLWSYVLWRMGWIRPDAGAEWLHDIRPATEGIRAALVDIWLRWDTVHYLRIIQEGYGPDERSAFFPLYPLLGKICGIITGDDGLLGLLLVSNLAAIGSIFLLDRIAYTKMQLNGHSTVIYDLVFYPLAFFLFVAYPQSLVLFLILGAYFSQLSRNLLMTFLFGVAAGLTHSTALPLAPLLFLRTFGFKERRLPWFLISLAPLLGIAGFMAWRVYVGFPPFQILLGSIWGKSVGLGVDFTGDMTPWVWLFRGWPNLVVLFLGLGTLYWCYKNRLFAMLGFQAVLLLIPMLTAPSFEPLAGMARYALVGFPMFYAFSSWRPQGWKRILLLALASGVNLYFCGIFIMWGFIG
jgi:hypothetical protein